MNLDKLDPTEVRLISLWESTASWSLSPISRVLFLLVQKEGLFRCHVRLPWAGIVPQPRDWIEYLNMHPS